MIYTAPLVGMRHRPPADSVVQNLPAGAELELRRQPDNPYDEFAVQVLLHGFSEEGKWQDLRAGLMEDQTDPDYLALFNTDDGVLHLGYVDSSKTGMARKISTLMASLGLETMSAKLGFGVDGYPQLELEVAEPKQMPAPQVMGPSDLPDQDIKDAMRGIIRRRT